MAAYSFSALTNGQAISFDPEEDVLVFDQASISAAFLRVTVEGGATRIAVISGLQAGKEVLLLDADPRELAGSNVSFADGSRLLFGDDSPGSSGDGLGNVLDGGARYDYLQGFGGNDLLVGGAGFDRLSGGAGMDTLNGGNGGDMMMGGADDDVYIVDNAGDTVVEEMNGGEDLVRSSVSYTLPQWVNHLTLVGGANNGVGNELDNRITGNAGNNALFGDSGSDTLIGNGGSDYLNGGSGADRLLGGAGDDDYGVDNAGDVVVEQENEGIDQVWAWIDYTLPAYVNNLQVLGPALNGFGNGIANVITGNAGDNLLDGGGGADRLVGRDGDDTLDGWNASTWNTDENVETLNGGLGDDEFRVDNRRDVLIDAGGTDTVVTHNVDWALGPGFENLVLSSAESASIAYGNALDNHISTNYSSARVEGRGGDDTLVGGWFSVRFYGGDGDDSLVGSNGRVDWLDGGTGNDTLDGSVGDDPAAGAAFVFSVAPGTANADLIVDFDANAGDMIRIDGRAMPEIGASGRFLFDDGRFYAGAGARDGHDADDRIIYDTTSGRLFYDADGDGPGAALLLARLQGAPNLTGSQVAVDDGTPGQTITGTSADDVLVGTGGGDTMSGAEGDDTVTGGGGDDVIHDGAGRDSIEGGLGHDAIWIDHGSGYDTVSGGRGNDVITDDGGANQFVFDVAPGEANWDQIYGFSGGSSGGDRIVLERDVFEAIGPGAFWSGDGRFYAASMAWTGVNGHDADDRILYNTNNGDLWYDADGSGPVEAQLIANLAGPATLLPTDILVT